MELAVQSDTHGTNHGSADVKDKEDMITVSANTGPDKEGMVKLVLKEGHVMSKPRKIVDYCTTLKLMLEDLPNADIPIPNISLKTMDRVFAFTEQWLEENPTAPQESAEEKKRRFRACHQVLTEKEKAFFKKLADEDQMELIIAAKFLENLPVLHATAQFIACRIRDNYSEAQVTGWFHITEEMTKEEEKNLKDELKRR